MGAERNYIALIIDHYTNIWGSAFTKRNYESGPMSRLSEEFRILEYSPNTQRTMWTYATCGMSSFDDTDPIELHIFSQKQDKGLVELLTAIAHYHMTGVKLNINHIVNFGNPWQDESICTYGLISLPY